MRVCLLLIPLLSAIPAHGQTLDVFPSLTIGEVHRLEVHSLRERTVADSAKTSATATTPVDVKILAASEKGFVLEWRQGRTRISAEGEAAPLEDPAMLTLLELAQQLVFELEFDATAEFSGLRNYERVRQQADKILDSLAEVLSRKGDSERARQAMTTVRALFADRKRLENIFLRDVLTYFFPMGKSFPTRQPHKYDTVLPNPFGGDPLRASGEITVSSIDQGKQLAQVTLRQSVSPDAMQIVLESLLKAMPDAPRPAPEVLSTLRGDISDRALFVLDLRTGWPLRTEYTRTLSVPGRSQTQKVTITRAL